MKIRVFTIILLTVVFSGCRDRDDVSEKAFLFEALTPESTHIDFNNRLSPDKDLNIMTYLYYFNGGGVGTGDFNNDGLVDVFFSGNLVPSRLYLNVGGLRFKDVTEQSGLSAIKGWCTGVSVVDINNDGMQDIYVNQVGGFRDFSGVNRLMVCKGIKDGVPTFSDEAAAFGLDFSGLATQSLFFDFDLDGDLDLYQMNHSVHENGTFGQRENFAGKIHPTSGDKLFRNDEGKYFDITGPSGIQSTAIGYGLGIAAGDINNDGWPDIYIGNDFHENDYLYINQRDGTFREVLTEQTMHTSRFSMGVDIADFNNDGFNDVVSLDMQPYDPVVLKSSLGEDEYSAFMFKLTYGYSVQFARNNLQMNNGNGTFSEIGMFAGIAATDWSWSSLFMDFDNDGRKDLFVSNGIPARMNDIDYVNFRTSNEDHRWKTQGNRMEMEDLEIIKRIPEIKFPNRFFRNKGDLTFEDASELVKGSPSTFSNGAAYADLDNDGDLDVVVNNINDAATVYRNLNRENAGDVNHFIALKLEGGDQNRNAIGARVLVYKDSSIVSNENYAVRGFQSSMAGRMLIGVGERESVDSVVVIWPDQTYERIPNVQFDTLMELTWRQGLRRFDFNRLHAVDVPLLKEAAKDIGLVYRHKENSFIEFDRERLIPFMVSTEGPAVAIGDANNDGLDDVFFGSSKWEYSSLYIQSPDGSFRETTSRLIRRDSVYEDVDAAFVDIDQDGDQDLVAAAGGNEFWGESPNLKQRFYLNDGKGNFNEKGFFPNVFMNASCVLPCDFDNDGKMDFFFGGRSVPKTYGVVPRSYLFRNLGNGSFSDVTSEVSKELGETGLVTDGVWVDVDGDTDHDLILAHEWGPIRIYFNEGKGSAFKSAELHSSKGLWNSLYTFDADGDGDLDLIAGNAGLNTKFKPSEEQPLRLYVNDFDDNGQVEQVLTYYVDGREIPFATHAELTKQLPALKKKYLFAKDFANASLDDLFDEKYLEDATVYEVNNLRNMFFENIGEGRFTGKPLPLRSQLSSVRAAAKVPGYRNGDAIVLAGNFYENNIDMGWYDASYGEALTFDGKTRSLTTIRNSLGIKGQVRAIKPLTVRGKRMLIFVRNNDAAILMEPVGTEVYNQ